MINKVLTTLSEICHKGQSLSVVLTGGYSAERLYRAWVEHPVFNVYRSSRFYFGDERCVPPNHVDSNYQMAKVAFNNMIDSQQYERIIGEASNPNEEARRYSELLPDSVDLLLLSVGIDGHIASLFPYDNALMSNEKVVFIDNAPKRPSERITITPKIVRSANNVIVIAAGEEKGRILAKSLSNQNDIDELPVRLTIGRTWILDEKALKAFQQYAPLNQHNTNLIYGK